MSSAMNTVKSNDSLSAVECRERKDLVYIHLYSGKKGGNLRVKKPVVKKKNLWKRLMKDGDGCDGEFYEQTSHYISDGDETYHVTIHDVTKFRQV